MQLLAEVYPFGMALFFVAQGYSSNRKKRPREGSNTAPQTPNKTASALALGNSLGNCVGDLQQIRTLLASLDASTLRQLLDDLE